MTKQSAGGKATAKILRQQAIDRYLKNPNICVYCHNIIAVDHQTIQLIRRKKFCNQSCGAKFNNALRPKKLKLSEPSKPLQCELPTRTKGELFASRKNYQSARSAIRQHAANQFFTYHKNPTCEICGYSKHIDVAHRKSVSSFSSDALIREINNIHNLAGLCPNCHWEFDHKQLNLVASLGVEPNITSL